MLVLGFPAGALLGGIPGGRFEMALAPTKAPCATISAACASSTAKDRRFLTRCCRFLRRRASARRASTWGLSALPGQRPSATAWRYPAALRACDARAGVDGRATLAADGTLDAPSRWWRQRSVDSAARRRCERL